MFKTIKSKILTVVGVASVAYSNAAAAISMDNQGVVTGSLELGTFYGLAVAVVVALGAVWAVKTGIRLIRG